MSMVGIPDFATLVSGEYPCFTSRLIYCIPSFTVTLGEMLRGVLCVCIGIFATEVEGVDLPLRI